MIENCKMNYRYFVCCLVLLCGAWGTTFAQDDDQDSIRQEHHRLDSLFISEVEQVKGPEKVFHAEPLYIDLIRDLGARKGEREWNVGLGMTDKQGYDTYQMLVEYEFAPVNRLGLEVELPFTLTSKGTSTVDVPMDERSRLNSLKTALQWSYYVSEARALSMALGYINEVTLSPFDRYRNQPIINGNIFNPFWIGAKRWGQNWHTLIYAGPHIHLDYPTRKWHTEWNVNSNFHYLIPGTRNFIGMEVNKHFYKKESDVVFRPQMRVGIAHNLLVGVVTGIPVSRYKERLSFFLRLIYEPMGKRHHKTVGHHSRN